MEGQILNKKQIIAFLQQVGFQKDFHTGNLQYYLPVYNQYIEANKKGFNLKFWNEETLHNYMYDWEQNQLENRNNLIFTKNEQNNNIHIYTNKML